MYHFVWFARGTLSIVLGGLAWVLIRCGQAVLRGAVHAAGLNAYQAERANPYLIRCAKPRRR